jgi:hypothetical protein
MSKLAEIKQEDLSWSEVATKSGGRSKPRQSRSVETRGVRICLIHLPSGLETKGEVPPGHYTKKQMRTEATKVKAGMMAELSMLLGKRPRSKTR